MSIHRTVGGKRSLLDSFNRSMPIPTAADGCDFRLLLRGSMVEAYVNGVLVVPFALPNTVSRGGFQQCVTPSPSRDFSPPALSSLGAGRDGGWAAGVRAPKVQVALTGAWAAAKLGGWLIGLPALFPMQ